MSDKENEFQQGLRDVEQKFDAEKEIERLRRVNGEHGHNLAKIIDYCKSKGIGKLGQSYIEQLIASHETAERRVEELERERDKRDTEQQIKAVNEVLDLGKLYTIGEDDFWQIADDKVEDFIQQLRTNGGE